MMSSLAKADCRRNACRCLWGKGGKSSNVQHSPPFDTMEQGASAGAYLDWVLHGGEAKELLLDTSESVKDRFRLVITICNREKSQHELNATLICTEVAGNCSARMRE